MTVCYICANTGYTEVIAVSKDSKKVEKAMFDWCDERKIKVEYHHGDYFFNKATEVGEITGLLIFEEVEEIL